MSKSGQPQTARELINWTNDRFERADLYYGHGTDNAYDEAVYLVLCSLGMSFEIPDSTLDAPLQQTQIDTVLYKVRQRIDTRIPVAYLVNEAWFAGLSFYVDERVLVPRSPIAELIEDEFSPWLKNPPARILDIGTGSGCIAIACALAFPQAIVDAVDISPEALEVTKKNIGKYSLADRVKPIQSDLFENLGTQQYDLIVTNPPYVSIAEVEELPPEYRHEPVLGLAAGSKGLDVVDKLLAESKSHLHRDGVIIVEVGYTQEAMTEAYPGLAMTWLDFRNGGEGVFLLGYDELGKYTF